MLIQASVRSRASAHVSRRESSAPPNGARSTIAVRVASGMDTQATKTDTGYTASRIHDPHDIGEVGCIVR
jgi:hypothetical protein